MATLASIRRALLPIHQLSLRSKLLPHRRAFHASSQHRFLDTCIGAVHTTLIGIHSYTGLPWVATIPCFAMVLRIFILSPITIYMHQLNRRRAMLKPVSLAWVHTLRVKVHQEHGFKGPKVFQKNMIKEYNRKSAEIRRRHGTQLWRNLTPFIQVPFFVIVAETLRRMCGANEGLIGLLTTGLFKENGSEIEAIPLEQLITQDQGKDPFPFEESFGNEGALWFPDLLVPDPLLLLPFVLSGTLFLSIFYQSSRSAGGAGSKWQRRFSNGIKVIALASPLLTFRVPSAMLLYFISSSLFGLGQFVLMDRYFPRKPNPKPCKPQDKRVLLGARPQD